MTKQHKIYSNAIDGKALAQFFSALGQSWAVKGALMPDAHAGYSLPLGAVVATDGVESSTLDESASAYKDIFEVMAMQSELVDVLHHIKPLINIKG